MAARKTHLKVKVKKKPTATRTLKTRTIKTGDGLTPQQLIAVSQLAMGKTRQEAADKAGVSLAGVVAMLKQPKVDKALADAKKEILEHAKNEAKIDVDGLINELLPIVRFDIRTLYDAKGDLKPVSEWSDAACKAVSGIEHEALYDGKGKDREMIGYLRKVKLWPKVGAASEIAKMIGAYQAQKMDVTGRVPGLKELLQAIDGANVGTGPDQG